MSEPRLTYFPARGRAELPRLLMAAGGIQWSEDHAVTEKWELEKLKKDGLLLFGQLPLLEWDGRRIVQTGAISRFLSRQLHFDGKTADEKLEVDMLYEGSRDFVWPLGTFGLGDDVKLMKQIKSQIIPRYMPVFEKKLNNSCHLVGENLTLADVGLFEALLLVNERIPEVFTSYPRQKEFLIRLEQEPNFRNYLMSPKRHPPSDQQSFAVIKEILGWN